MRLRMGKESNLRLERSGVSRVGTLGFVDEVLGAVDNLHADDFVVNLEVAKELLVFDDVAKDGVSAVQNVGARRRELGFAK
jgi:hypothetical protein